MLTLDEVYLHALVLSKSIETFWNLTDLTKERSDFKKTVYRWEREMENLHEQAKSLTAKIEKQREDQAKGKSMIAILGGEAKLVSGAEAAKQLGNLFTVTKSMGETAHQAGLAGMVEEFEIIAIDIKNKVEAEHLRRRLQNSEGDKKNKDPMRPEEARIKAALDELKSCMEEHKLMIDLKKEQETLKRLSFLVKRDIKDNCEDDAKEKAEMDKKVELLRKVEPKSAKGDSPDIKALVDKLIRVTDVETYIQKLYAVSNEKREAARVAKIDARLISLEALRAGVDAEKERRERKKEAKKATMQEKKNKEKKTKMSLDETSVAAPDKTDPIENLKEKEKIEAEKECHELQEPTTKAPTKEQELKKEEAEMRLDVLPEFPVFRDSVKRILLQPGVTFAMQKWEESHQSLTTAAPQANATEEEKSRDSAGRTNAADSVATSPNKTRAPGSDSPSSRPKRKKTCGDHCHDVPTTSRNACCRSL